MGRADQYLVRGNAGLFGCQLLHLFNHLGSYSQVVHQDHRQRRRSVIQNQGSGVERIMGAVGHIRAEETRHVQGELFGRDIYGRRPGTQLDRLAGRTAGRGDDR